MDPENIAGFMVWLEEHYALGFTNEEINKISRDYSTEVPVVYTYKPSIDHDITTIRNWSGSIDIHRCSCGTVFRDEAMAYRHAASGRL